MNAMNGPEIENKSFAVAFIDPTLSVLTPST